MIYNVPEPELEPLTYGDPHELEEEMRRENEENPNDVANKEKQD